MSTITGLLLAMLQGEAVRRGFLPASTLLQILLVMVAIGFIVVTLYRERPNIEDTIVHWHVTIPGLQLTPDHFYAAVKTEIEPPTKGASITIQTVHLSEKNAIGYYRPYLQIRHLELAYYIFAAPLGKESFFVSSWLVVRRPLLATVLPRLPIIGWLIFSLAKLFESYTFYTYDSALHFHETIHAALLRSIDKFTSIQQAASLLPEVRKPIMRELYSRPMAPLLPPGR